MADTSSLTYQKDDAQNIAVDKRNPKSHLKIYLPTIPYAHIMRLINGTLVRLDESPRGWEYFLAYKYEKINPLTYDFWLRQDVKFQDGSLFDADAVVSNFQYFQKKPFTYTDIHHKLSYVEKIGTFKVRLHLNAPYGMLFNDLARINLYTQEYLEKYDRSNNILAENTQAPGAYGCGPFTLVEGYATGLSQSEKIVLKANPYYFDKGKPYIETVTIYTKMPIGEVVNKISEKEGILDIAFIPFDKKTEIVNSPYAKLVSTESTYNFSIHMNLMNPKSVLKDQKIRQALNQALEQKKLIKFAYKKEGTASPFLLSANSPYAKEISKKYLENPKYFFSQSELHKILNGIKLKIVTQDRFVSLWRGIEYQLNNYGVQLNYDITTDESYVLTKLLTNRKNHYDWDLLSWGNDDWYRHPWTVFAMLYTKNQWSAIDKDSVLDKKLEELFTIDSDSKKFQPLIDKILEYTYAKAYMLSVPSPNIVLALNKEVIFTPSPVAILRLWEAKITPYHWSIRGEKKLPKSRLEFKLPKRIKYDE